MRIHCYLKRKSITTWFLPIIVLALSQLSIAAPKLHQGAITAKELLVLMSACELLKPAKYLRYPSETLTDMCTQGKKLLKIGMSNNGPTAWTWQPDKMKYHSDFKYAGNNNIGPHLQTKVVDGISMDSHHFYAKWPLFFLSAKEASSDEELIYFNNAIAGLINNLFDNVVSYDANSCIVRYKNYIDGTNGVYRWNWRNKGADYGSGAYGLSYTPFVSSLALLDHGRIADHYKDIADCFPYSKTSRRKYFSNRKLEKEKLMAGLSKIQPSRAVRNEILSPKNIKYYNLYLKGILTSERIIGSDEAYSTVVGDKMLVMHYAFIANNAEWISDFGEYALRISSQACIKCKKKFKFYHELHALYFLSNYVNLVSTHFAEHTPENYPIIFERTARKIEDLYLNSQKRSVSNFGWDGIKVFSFKEYTNWKLDFYKRPQKIKNIDVNLRK